MASADKPRKEPQKPARDEAPPSNFDVGAADADMRITGGDAFEKDVDVQLSESSRKENNPDVAKDRDKIFPESHQQTSKQNTPPPT